MRGDGDGWVHCALGHRHWGRHGAAGLLLRHVAPTGPRGAGGPDGEGGAGGEGGEGGEDRGDGAAGHGVRLLMQHRAPWSAEGGTWGVPGGARDSSETALEAATRECAEETGVPPQLVRPRGAYVVDHGGWSYTTVIADIASRPRLQRQEESLALEWVPEDEVEELPLHPGFASAWPDLRAPAVTLLVDVANVMGSRPDGWWRDRLGAATRVVEELAALPQTVRQLGSSWWSVREVVAVVEGAARAASSGPAASSTSGVSVVAADGSGDDALVAQAASLARTGRSTLLVTADRELRQRVESHGATSVGPAHLLHALEAPSDGR